MAPVVILPSAHKWELTEEDIRHALRNAIDVFPDQGIYELTIAVGPAPNGVTLLEVGYDVDEGGRLIVVHAMKARKKYLR